MLLRHTCRSSGGCRPLTLRPRGPVVFGLRRRQGAGRSTVVIVPFDAALAACCLLLSPFVRTSSHLCGLGSGASAPHSNLLRIQQSCRASVARDVLSSGLRLQALPFHGGQRSKTLAFAECPEQRHHTERGRASPRCSLLASATAGGVNVRPRPTAVLPVHNLPPDPDSLVPINITPVVGRLLAHVPIARGHCLRASNIAVASAAPMLVPVRATARSRRVPTGRALLITAAAAATDALLNCFRGVGRIMLEAQSRLAGGPLLGGTEAGGIRDMGAWDPPRCLWEPRPALAF